MNDLSMHIIDIIQNSISAGASLMHLRIEESIEKDLLSIEIEDNGKGIAKENIERLRDPFFTSRTTRKVGLGIPLLRDSALQSGGDVEIESELGVGTKVKATFVHSNIDRPPLGDIANSFILMVSSNPLLDFVFDYCYNGTQYKFDTREVKEVLDGIPLNEPSVIKMLTQMVRDNIDDLKQ